MASRGLPGCQCAAPITNVWMNIVSEQIFRQRLENPMNRVLKKENLLMVTFESS
jgi:hypothetical protein